MIHTRGRMCQAVMSSKTRNCLWFQPVLVCVECFCEGGEDKRIPLLRDVFDAFPNTPVNIDIKINNDTLIKKVCVCFGALKTAFPLSRLSNSSLYSDCLESCQQAERRKI